MKQILLFVEEKLLKNFLIVPLHLMIIFQPKGKKEDIVDKDDEVPKFIEKNKICLKLFEQFIFCFIKFIFVYCSIFI